MQDNYREFQRLGAELYVISVDSPAKSKVQVVQAEGIQFPVLADEDKKTIRAYGVDGGLFAKPSAFVIDKSGIIRYRSVGNTTHRESIDTLIEQLKLLRTFRLTVPSGTSLVHFPSVVTEFNGASRTVAKVSDLFDILGGEGNVNWLITTPAPERTRETQFQAFFKPSNVDFPANAPILPYTGILVSLRNTVMLELTGDPVEGAVRIIPGPNLVGIPNKNTSIKHVSDFARYPDFLARISLISIFADGKFHPFRPGDIASGQLDGDLEIVPGQAFVVVAKANWFQQF